MKIIIEILPFIFLIYSCTSDTNKSNYTDKEHAYFTNIDDLKENNLSQTIWMNHQTFIKDSSNNYCSKMNQSSPSGLGAKINIPEEILNSNFEISVDSKVKKEGLYPNYSLVIQMNLNDSLIYWNGFQLGDFIKQNNVWYPFSKEVIFPRNFSKKGITVSIYFMNQSSSNAYVDDLKITFKKVSSYSFIPKLVKQDNKNNKIVHSLNNDFYKINLYETGNLEIVYRNGKTIFKGIRHIVEILNMNESLPSIYTNSVFSSSVINKVIRHIMELLNMNEPLPSTYVNSVFSFSVIDENNVKLTGNNHNCQIDININIDTLHGGLTFKTKTRFLDSTKLYREAIIFDYVSEIDEVYKKNRQVDQSTFEDEYWLDKQGVKIGTKENTCYIYHPKNVSSLQLSMKEKVLIINLDYCMDHPLIYFPLEDSSINYFQDISSSVYARNDSRENEFSFSIGTDNDAFPRILKNPFGFLAAYVFTEHADYTDIRTHRAVYFGSSEIKRAKEATGGFIKYNIPVTKSVFYMNREKIMNNKIEPDTLFNTPIASIKHTPEFLEFLKEIHNYGIEVCLHTPEQYTTNTNDLTEACKFMKNNFNTTTWIDHGYNNEISHNREDIVCDGLNKQSEFYSADILKKYGVKYFWNCYYEDVTLYKDFCFYSFSETPYVGFGNFFPTPDYWSHKKISDAYFWKTTLPFFPKNKSHYYFNEQRINDFIDNYTVEINHCYPAWINPNYGFWAYGENDEIVVNKDFDNGLKILGNYRDKGLINLTTINDMLDYQIKMEEVTLQNIEKNTFLITNNSNNDINGISLATKAKAVYVDEKIPDHKLYKGDLIFWLDIKAKEKKRIHFLIDS